jgi:hypothetical protein
VALASKDTLLFYRKRQSIFFSFLSQAASDFHFRSFPFFLAASRDAMVQNADAFWAVQLWGALNVRELSQPASFLAHSLSRDRRKTGSDVEMFAWFA